jgi:hypothetical protein
LLFGCSAIVLFVRAIVLFALHYLPSGPSFSSDSKHFAAGSLPIRRRFGHCIFIVVYNSAPLPRCTAASLPFSSSESAAICKQPPPCPSPASGGGNAVARPACQIFRRSMLKREKARRRCHKVLPPPLAGEGWGGGECLRIFLPNRRISNDLQATKRGRLVPSLLFLRARALEHDPEKWEPVFGKDHAPIISAPAHHPPRVIFVPTMSNNRRVARRNMPHHRPPPRLYFP